MKETEPKENGMPEETMETMIKRYMSNPYVFADLFNGALHQGRHVIKPNDLTQVNPVDLYFPKIQSEFFYHGMTIMKDSTKTYVLHCVEDQTQFDRKRGCENYFDTACVESIVPLIVNFDSKPWNNPTSSHEEMALNDDEHLRYFFTNYKINLFDPHANESFEVFGTGLKEIFQRVKDGQKNEIAVLIADRSEYISQEIQDMCLFDHRLMKLALSNNIPLVQFILRIVLNKKGLVVTKAEYHDDDRVAKKQWWYIAVDAVDEDGTPYHVEMRKFDSEAEKYITRMCGLIQDENGIYDLPDRFVVFLSESDVKGLGRAICTYNFREEVTYESLGYGFHLIYINGEYEDVRSDIGKLIHDFRCSNTDEMFFDRVAHSVDGCKHGTLRSKLVMAIEATT